MQRLRTRLRASASRGAPAALSLDFLTATGTLDPRITFSRGSQATITDATGKLTYAPNNLLTNSESFEAAAWVKANATVTSNAAAAPDGSTTADQITSSAANGYIYQSFSAAIATYIFSVYVKSVSAGTSLELQLYTNTGGAVIASTSFTTTGAWQRVSVVGAYTAASGAAWAAIGGNGSFSTGETIYIWGAQLEQVTYQTTPGTYNSTSPKNLLGYTQEFDNAAWTKSNAFVQTNLLLQSEAFDNGVWIKEQQTVSANTSETAAPNGTFSADKITLLAGTFRRFIYESPSIVTVNGASYTSSVFIKSGTYNYFQLAVSNQSTDFANFDLSTGVVGTTGGSVSAAINSVGGGWYRVSITYTAAGVNRDFVVAPVPSSSAGRGDSVTATGTETYYLWGAQLVQGSTAGDYQRTDAAAAAVQYTAPDGTLSADKLVETTATSSHYALQAATVAAAPYTFSTYAKAGERSFVSLAFDGLNAWFNLSTGAVGTVEAGLTASITAVGNGWYRCAIFRTVSVAGSKSSAIYPTNANNVVSYTGDGTSGIFIWGAQLSDSASLDPYVYNPVAAPTAAAYYGPRFDYDPVTLAAKGLLIEEQRTNLAFYSDQVGAWFITNGTVTANSIISPDGTVNADTITDNSTSAAHQFYQNISSLSASIAYAFSVYAKAGTLRYLTLSNAGTTNSTGGYAVFDLQAGTITQSAALSTGTLNSATIIPVGNGWYRCTVVATSGDTARYAIASTSNAATYTADTLGRNSYIGSSQSLYLWGAQLEAGSFATSYIPTVASQVTRSADVATMLGDNFKSWYNLNAGTFAVDADTAKPTTLVATAQILSASDGTANNSHRVRFITAGIDAVTSVGGVTQVDMTEVGYSVNVPSKVSYAYLLNDYGFTVNGGTVQTDTSATVPTVNSLQLGTDPIGSNALNGHIRSLGYYNTRQPNATLQALTNPSTTPSLALNFISDTYTVGA